MDKWTVKYIKEAVDSSDILDEEFIYVYQSHMGGYFISTTNWTVDMRYCETCGDCDTLICSGFKKDIQKKINNYIANIEELIKYFNQHCSLCSTSSIDEKLSLRHKCITKMLSCDVSEYLDEYGDVICPRPKVCQAKEIDNLDDLNQLLKSKIPMICKYCSIDMLLDDIDF